jgi:hypothetical protein
MTAVVCLSLYTVIVGGLLIGNHRWHRLQPTTQRATYPPPVPKPVTPPFSQTLPDPSWFAGMPVEILSDDAVHSLFDELIDLEGLR